MSKDERLLYISNTICSICNLNNDSSINNITTITTNSNDVVDFLDDANIITLKAIVSSNGKVKYSTRLKSSSPADDDDEDTTEVIFIKRNKDTITINNITKCISIHKSDGSNNDPLGNLYDALHGLYCPVLLSSSLSLLPPNVQQLLSNLESSIKHTITDDTTRYTTTTINDITNIKEIEDEIQFWKFINTTTSSSNNDSIIKYKPLASKLVKLFNDINFLEGVVLDDIDLSTVQSMLPVVFDTLNNIWNTISNDDDDRCYYPQNRMINLFNCISNSLTRYIQKNLLASLSSPSSSLWDDQSSESRMKIQIASKILKEWCDIPTTLITKYWSNHDDHKWNDSSNYKDKFTSSFSKRLDSILYVRGLADEVSQLLSSSSSKEIVDYDIDKIFKALKETNPIFYNSSNDSDWNEITKEYENALKPLDDIVAKLLKAKITEVVGTNTSGATTSDNLLLVLSSYKSLVERPAIRKVVQPERESLLTLLKGSIKKIQQKVDFIDVEKSTTDGVSTLLNQLKSLREVKSRLISLMNSSTMLLQDLKGYDSFVMTGNELKATIIKVEEKKFLKWLSDIQDKIDENNKKFFLNDQSVTFQNNKLIIVDIPDFLSNFITEFHEVKQLGITKNSDKQVAKVFEKFEEVEKTYRNAILLKKVSNFINSISEQIIDSQMGLLKGTMAEFAEIPNRFSALVKIGEKSPQTFAAEFEKYLCALQDTAEKRSAENRWLRKSHKELCRLTVLAMNIDLLGQTDKWKANWRLIKDTVNAVLGKYSEKAAKKWVKHWDHQIYKALEASYQMGLSSINESLPNIAIEIIYSNKQLEFKPPLEQIRQLYYHEMKKFIAMPNTFEGLGNASVYKRMGQNNVAKIVEVYSKAEELFGRLSALLKKYSKLAKISSLDSDRLENIKDPQDYEKRFKELIQEKADIAALPDTDEVDCCKISLKMLKSIISDLYLRLGDELLIKLRRSLLEEFKEVDQFLDLAIERLSSRPHTVDEIGIANKQWKEFDEKQDSIRKNSKLCVEKKRMLLQYAPGTVVDIVEISSRMANLDGEGGRWDSFDIAMSSFFCMIEEQKESLKGTLEEEVINLNASITKFWNRWKNQKPKDSNTNWEYNEVVRIFESIDDWKRQFKDLKQDVNKLIESCESFGLPAPRFDTLQNLEEDLSDSTRSFDILRSYYDQYKEIAEQDWLTFSVNVYALEDFAIKWIENIKSKYPKGTQDGASQYVITAVQKIQKCIPTLKYCRGEPFKEDHWTELLQGKLQLPKEVRRENLKVEHFLIRLDILLESATLIFVKQLNTRALGEVQIREALQELKAWERSAEIKLLTVEESGRKLPLIKDWKDLFVEMGDKQSLLASLKESQFFKAFQDQGQALEAKIAVLDFALHTLNQVQRKWVYLEPIFSRGALPSEEARFRRVDEDFSDIINNIARDPKLFYLADEQIFPYLSDKLRSMLDQLERCQKALLDFLEAKRSAMPRFYFIGDDDLLEILGQAKNPAVIQSHLKKLFQGIHKVKFNDDNTKIISIISSANEIVDLETPVPVSEKVEEWLHTLASEMRITLANLLIKCLDESKLNWNYPSQIICLAECIKFTVAAEKAITKGELSELLKQQKRLLNDVTSSNLTDPLKQLKMKSLVFDIVHNIDVVGQLLKKKVDRLDDWQWKKQLRYYLLKEQAIVRMYDAKFDYTYEYQGNAPKLVHTPLTDKCYLTLTQGMHMGFGGNPYGPAGTGKTESVKALASCLGRQVLVFNCDEALESTSMVRIFVGLVKCGAWGCFDEFNRLKEDQLSAISQQIQTIQDAIKMKVSPIQLLGRNVNVDFNSGIFVTLNPAGKGYGGRSRLPDNLKALFRPVAMGAPDNELIAEVSLVTEGFSQAKDLACKIVSLFKFSRELLSAQQHYDWGLRALKAVLLTAGKILQSHRSSGNDVDVETENEILIKAMRVNTLSKLTFSDTPKFLSLIGDVFPGVKSADITGGELEEAIIQVMKEKPFYLVEDAAQIKKIIQLREALNQRMGCVVVGPSGCGKSTLWKVLKAAMIKCGQQVVTHVMNPKSMHRQRLLGYMDIDTREWFDGVLTDAARKVVRESSDVQCWIICDGDVDPEWIESLNSVLDDNHLLTLPNGERISFGPNVNFLFETHDLKFASPATISRMGMIFLSDDDLDVSKIVQRWLSMSPDDTRKNLSKWIDEIFYKALDYVRKCDNAIETTLVGTIMNGLSQVKDSSTREEFICGLIRGIGGNLNLSQRIALAKEIFQWSDERPPDMGAPLDCIAENGKFKQINKFDQSRNDIDINVAFPTIHLQRAVNSLEPLIANMEPFLLVGPQGCGKSLIINYAFRQRRSVSIATINCNAQTTADDVISKIAQTCSLFSSTDGRVYRPRDCERLVIYLKDINLPHPDMYNTCQLIAFLQQIITFEGFYDENLEFLKLERIQIVASMNAVTTVGRYPLSTRFTAIVKICVIDYPETSELVNVYDAFLTSVFKNYKGKDTSSKEALASMIVNIYQKIKEKFTVDDRRHYIFTPRDVTAWVKNICRYDLAKVNIIDTVAHEACRIFRDRLVGQDARTKFDQLLSGVIRSDFKHTFEFDSLYTTLGNKMILESSTGNEESKGESKGEENDDTEKASPSTLGRRMGLISLSDFKKVVNQGIMLYERENRQLNILLFDETLEYIARIDRVLSSSRGHMLLVGRSGVGRRNAVSIVSFMLGYEIISPSISRGYGSKQFMIDLKVALYTAGVKGEHVVLFIEDFQITTDAILELINSLLSSGEAPGVYTTEELEPLLSPLRERMRDEDSDCRTPYEFFVHQISKYLHIVLNMDPAHPQFLYRCESNPALYTQTAVLWVGEWSDSSLESIPQLITGMEELLRNKVRDNVNTGEEKNNDEEKFSEGKESKDDIEVSNDNITTVSTKSLLSMILDIHKSAVSLGATPKDYISFLKTWLALYQIKKAEISNELGHLEAGLSKLLSAADIVNDLRVNAAQQEKDLRIAQTAADRAMEEISKALTGASERRIEVAEVKRTVADNEIVTKERKAEIEGELAEIQPILDDAKQAVGQIKPEHLNEIRSLTAPPEAIADVLAAVLMLLGVQDLSWLSMKKFLSNRGVKDDILNYDAKRITGDLRKNVAKLIKKKSTSFDADNIKRVSIAAAPMAAWVKAQIRYSLVIEKIQPLELELEEEVMKLEKSQRRLETCEEELKEIDDRVKLLKAEFSNRTAEAERLKRNLQIAGTTLDKAEALIKQLSGEQARWKSQTAQLKSDLAKLPTKVMLASGFSTYLAKSPEDMRTLYISKWSTITGVTNFVFKRFMSTESQLLQWKGMGLPSDDLSQENSLVIANATDRVPFIIDPASAATEWLKAYLAKDKNRPLEVVINHDTRFVNQVELAVRFGKTLLILEVDGVEPMLYPLCRKDLTQQGSRNVVAIGEKSVDYNEAFRMFLVTRNPNPEILPDGAALVNQINFTVTRSGLEGQMLGLAIQHEEPELEKAKGAMLQKEESFKVQLASLEKELLEALATAEGNLLENSALIESLTRTKEKAAEIEDALIKSADASLKLDQQREVYRPFAKTGSMLFFAVRALQSVSHMYQFSLASFLLLFNQSLKADLKSRRSEDRLTLLCSDLEVRVLHFIGRALFKADRPMFALHLVRNMRTNEFQSKEWDIFTGTLVCAVGEERMRDYPSWAPSERQSHFKLLATHLPDLIKDMDSNNTSKWSRFSSSLEAEKDLPSIKGVSPFQRVLIIQALRPDRLQSTIFQFCAELLNVDSISPPPLSLASLYAESSCRTPLLLLIPSGGGADPSKELQDYASKTVGAGQYEELAMGGGQQDNAIHLLRAAAANGTWLCLQNLHLVISWLPTLEKELASLQPQPEFRLWLTSEGHDDFPSILLQESLKATYESPPGLKKNLLGTFDSFDPDVFKSSAPVKSKLLFLLSCFHSMIQERRTYIPQGWTKFYEFSYGDLRAGTFIMEAASEVESKSGQLDWEAIYGLMEDAIYGGRIDNMFDMRVLTAYLRLFFTQKIVFGGDREIIPGTPLQMPSTPDFDSYKKVITQLPDGDVPYLFCLPDNIEGSLQRTTSSSVIRQLRALSSIENQSSKYDREKWRSQLNPILDLWQQLTSSSNDIINRNIKVSKAIDDEDPLVSFVRMECDLAGEICTMVDSTLVALKKVLFGSGLLTPAIQLAATSLLSDSLPREWLNKWEGPDKPQAWLNEIVRKRLSLNKLKALKNQLLNDKLSLADFFHPGTFINALRQQTSRQLGVAIDVVTMVSSWGNSNSPELRDCPLPCPIAGLLLQGASLKGGELQDLVPDANEISPAPVVNIGFIIRKEENSRNNLLDVPLYHSPSREDFIVSLQMPLSSSSDSNKFILSGIGLFLCETD